MNNYILFTGTDCCLCDVAKQLLNDQGLSEPDLKQINVKVERDYFHDYGARIPVLKKTSDGAELGWPFDAETLREFLD